MPNRIPVYLGNSAWNWVWAAATACLVLGALYFIRMLALRYRSFMAARLSPGFAEALAEILAATSFPIILVLSLSLGSRVLELGPRAENTLIHVAMLALLVQAGLWGTKLVGWWLQETLDRRRAHPDAATMIYPVLGFMLRMVLWTLVLLLVLDSFAVNLTAFVASLGVGGIAVALAVQNILGDIFASLSIALDKPFIPQDFIIVGDVLGTVENIGLKSTQIRALSGEQIIISNNDLLKSRIRNFKRMAERRVVFSFGLTYLTPADLLELVPRQVEAIIRAQPRTRFDRAHLFQFGESALVFEVVYYVLDADYNIYMDIQQAINLALFRTLQDEGVSFAHPTRIVVPAPPQAGSKLVEPHAAGRPENP